MSSVSGPFSYQATWSEPYTNINGGISRNPVVKISRTWYRQRTSAGEARKPLAFTLNKTYLQQYELGIQPWYRVACDAGPIVDSTHLSWSASKAYQDFLSNVSEGVDLLVNAWEGDEAFKMIALRSGQLLRAARAVRHGRFREAARQLGVDRYALIPWNRLSKRDLAKSFGANWLEYHFGWEPLVKDIYNSIDLLSKGPPSGRFVGRGVLTKTYTMYDGSYAVSWNPWIWVGNYMYRKTVVVRSSTRMQATVVVDSENLFLASQLGLTNPAAVLWEVVPFSFVVDWFTNVGDYISQFSDLAGCRLVDAFSTHFQTTKTFWEGNPKQITYNNQRGLLGFKASTTRVHVNRVMGLPTEVTLGFRPLKVPSISRAATAVSLLSQFFRNPG